MIRTRLVAILILVVVGSLLMACDPLAPYPTPTAAVFIVTPDATATLPPSATVPPSATPSPEPTSTASPTPTPSPCEGEGGQVIAFDEFRSDVADENLRYRVYIPPCYGELQKRYPVVYLLHGLNQTEDEWETINTVDALEQGLRLGALGPMILVMPYTGRIATRDDFPPTPSYETAFLEELVPAIERDFCTINTREYRGLGGISRGGFWAFSIGMRNPDLFGKLGGHSAAFDENNASATYNPLDLALNASFLAEADLDMYVDNAAADPVGRALELFSSRLSARGIPHTYIIHPNGDHDNEYWASHIAEYLSFYAEGWPRENADLPSCLESSP